MNRDCGRKMPAPRGAARRYEPGESSGLLTGVALRRLVSIPRRLIFWFSVLSGIWNLSAASVWFQLVLSSMSTITLRSTSSMI